MICYIWSYVYAHETIAKIVQLPIPHIKFPCGLQGRVGITIRNMSKGPESGTCRGFYGTEGSSPRLYCRVR